MREYSADANLYIIANSPIDKKTLPDVDVAKKGYRLISSQFGEDNINIRKINKESIENDYKEAVTVFENYIVNIYKILSGKGYITRKEWNLMLDKISDSRFIFPDIVMCLGTTKTWVFSGSKEEFVNDLLKRKGFYGISIRESEESNDLYDKPMQFINQLVEKLNIPKKTFDNIERALNGSGYIGTRKRLNYLTIYDFLKYHIGLGSKPDKEKLINILENSPDKNTVNIKSAVQSIRDISGDFWNEYERYRSLKMVSSLVYWFSESAIKHLSEDMYEYFSNNVDKSVLDTVLSALNVHTAVLNSRKLKVVQKGTAVTFSNFSIDNSGGNIFATVEVGGFAESYSNARKKVRLASPDELVLNDLEYNITYYVSLWEVFGDNDALKLGNLKTVTPGIEWPRYDYITAGGNKNNDFSAITDDQKLEISLSVMGNGNDYGYAICCVEGTESILSPETNKGVVTAPALSKINGEITRLSAIIPNLQYDREYNITVFVFLNKNKKIFSKLNEIRYVHKKVQTISIIKRNVIGSDIVLDFAGNEWPSELSRSSVITFACRTDRYPANPDDGESDLSIKPLTYDSYRQGVFKLNSHKGKKTPPVVYICGWMFLREGKSKIIIRNLICEINYDVKNNTIIFDKKLNSFLNFEQFPEFDFYAFDKSDRSVYSKKNIKLDAGSMQFQFQPSGKVKYVIIQATDIVQRQMYTFRHAKTGSTGKAKIGGLF